MPIYSSFDSEEYNDRNSLNDQLFGPKRPLHSVLGGGQVADIILWRNKNLSVAILLGFTTLWFMLEVLEYTFVSLVFHVMILGILMVFISKFVIQVLMPFFGASTDYTNWEKIEIILHYWSIELYIRFFLVNGLALMMISVIAQHFNPLNLLFFCVICLGTLPVFYEKYEKEVDYLINKWMKYLTMNLYKFGIYVKEKKAN